METVKGVPRDGGDKIGGRKGKSNEAESDNVDYRGKNAKSNPEQPPLVVGSRCESK